MSKVIMIATLATAMSLGALAAASAAPLSFDHVWDTAASHDK